MENLSQNNFCPNCGSPIAPGQSFCAACGKAVVPQHTSEVQYQQNANPYTPQQSEQTSNPYASQQSAQTVNPYANQGQEQMPNPYANQRQGQMSNPYASQQSAQTVNPYANQRQGQMSNPYANQGQEQMPNPYASQQSAQTVDPYANQRQGQMSNPYANQGQEQTSNPYAYQGQEQMSNPYASQQSAQTVDPYANQRQEQMSNPYASQQSTSQNAAYGQQSFDPYSSTQPAYGYNNGMTTSQSNFTEPKKRSKKPFIIAGTAILGVAAVAVAGVLIFNMLKPSGGPITRIAEGAKNLTNADSATISIDMSYDDQSIGLDGSYEIDREKKEIVAVFEENASGGSSSTQNMKVVIYCKDGVRRTGVSNSGSDMIYAEVSKDNLDEFFDRLEDTNDPNWDDLISDDVKKYIYTDKIEEVSNDLIGAFESDEGKKALGIEESSVDGGTKYSFNINPYDTAKIAVDTIEPIFKDKTQYDDIKSSLSDAESTLNSLNIKFDITLDNAGNFSGLDFNSFGMKAEIKITDINNTKVKLSSVEIDEIKNAEIGNIADGNINDYLYGGGNSYLDDYSSDYFGDYANEYSNDYTYDDDSYYTFD